MNACNIGVSQQFSLLLAVVLEEQNILSIYESEEFDVISKKSLPNPRSQRFISLFSSKSFVVLDVKYRSEIHFELNIFKDLLFIYFWLHWVFIAVHGLSLVAASRGSSLLRCTGFSFWWRVGD